MSVVCKLPAIFMKIALRYIIFLTPIIVFGQYPFEKFKAPKYKSLEFIMQENNNIYEYSCAVNSFFSDKENLQVTIHGNTENEKENHIELKSNQISKKYYEEIFLEGADSLFVTDFNGDHLKDLKIICYYKGCGLASLNVRVVYFFQKKNHEFTKIAFDDKMDNNRKERDINGDGNYEIITMTLQEHGYHNYWLFNTYNYKNDNLVCVNEKMNYPIMIQYLLRDNFEISTKISIKTMKKYELKKPEEISIE